MTRFLSLAFAALGALPLVGPVAAGQPAPAPKFAFINSQLILERAPGRAEAQAQFEKERDGLQATGQKMSDSLQALVNAYQKAQATLTTAQKEQREKEIRDKQVEFDQRFGQMERQMQQRQLELVQPIMNHIRETLERVRNEEGYLFIFDVAAEGGSIVAADKNLDITDRVVARLKPIPVTVTRTDTTKVPAAAKPAPAGITKPPTKPPAQ
jgi:outer membrane protein